MNGSEGVGRRVHPAGDSLTSIMSDFPCLASPSLRLLACFAAACHYLFKLVGPQVPHH